MENLAIQCVDIQKSYGEGNTRTEALRGVNFDVALGKLTLLVGPSGSGKTTLLSIITSILKPDKGKLFILGKDILAMTENERLAFSSHHVGIVYQSLFLIPMLNVIENVSLPLLISGSDEKSAREKAFKILKKLQIEKYAETFPENLSKGQQQRVAIARALVHDPAIIVCDEPTSSLDHTNGMLVMDILHEIARQDSKAVMVVTHDHRIFSFADQIAEMDDGQIIKGGQSE